MGSNKETTAHRTTFQSTIILFSGRIWPSGLLKKERLRSDLYPSVFVLSKPDYDASQGAQGNHHKGHGNSAEQPWSPTPGSPAPKPERFLW
jgi:hypothetical protein